MATKLANALRAQAAIDRITQAVENVTGTPLVLPTHRDPDIEHALCYEAIADALEAQSAKPVAPTTAPAGVRVTKGPVEPNPAVEGPVGKGPRK